MNPKNVFQSMLGMLLGIAIYSGVVAPLIKDGAYAETAWTTFRDTGISMGATVIVICTVWILIVAFVRKAKK